jgi:hypothetical protein
MSDHSEWRVLFLLNNMPYISEHGHMLYNLMERNMREFHSDETSIYGLIYK